MGMELTRMIVTKYANAIEDRSKLGIFSGWKKKYYDRTISNYTDIILACNIFKLMDLIIQDCISDDIAKSSIGKLPTWMEKFPETGLVNVNKVAARYIMNISVPDINGRDYHLSYIYKSNEIEIEDRSDDNKVFSFTVSNGRALTGSKIIKLWDKINPAAKEILIDYLI